MSLSQTMTRRRDADLLQRALDGDPKALAHPLLDDGVGDLAVLRELAERLPPPQLRPDAAFVARLRDELLREAARRPVPAAPDRLVVPRTSAPAGPRTVTVPRGGRLLAGLATMAVLLAVVIGGVSTRALPGDSLYPVKLMIGDAQVRLAGSDLGRGKALLGQLDHRLDEVDALVAAGDPPPSLVDDTLLRASDDLGDAQRRLLTTDSGSPDPRALQVLADASAQATGRLAGLRQRVPVGSVPAVDRLLSQLTNGRAAMLGQLDQLTRAHACDGLCDSVRATLDQQGAQLARLLGAGGGGTGTWAFVPGSVSSHLGQGGGTTQPGGSLGVGPAVVGTTAPTSAPHVGTTTGSGSVSVQLPGASLPGVSLPGVGVSAGTGGGVVATAPGPTVSLPGASIAVPSITASLPGTGSSTGLPLPGVTVPGATSTIGGVTVPVPGVSVGGDCGLGLGDLCLGG